MKRKRHSPEQIVRKLREVESRTILLASPTTMAVSSAPRVSKSAAINSSGAESVPPTLAERGDTAGQPDVVPATREILDEVAALGGGIKQDIIHAVPGRVIIGTAQPTQLGNPVWQGYPESLRHRVVTGGPELPSGG